MIRAKLARLAGRNVAGIRKTVSNEWQATPAAVREHFAAEHDRYLSEPDITPHLVAAMEGGRKADTPRIPRAAS